MNNDQVTYYSQRAEEYEKIYEKPERQQDIPKVIDYLQKHFNNKAIIEIACGTGYWTQHISKTAKNIIATDINETVIDIAKSKMYERENVKIQLADVFNLPDEIGTYEAGFGGFIWSHIPKQNLILFLQNFLSVIKSGGLVIFVDNNYVEGSSTPIYKTAVDGNTYQKRILMDGSEYSIIKNFPTDEELLSLIKPVCTEVEITRFEYYWAVKFFKK
ncbi:MAG: class I SAM-dependent methyltransferase [Ignavibacterium sp.]|nr:MAG: class I SAM-dependent methyltransferase [Ignavibacterium sp.]